MVAVGVTGLNLNDPAIKYFDIYLVQSYFTEYFKF